MVALSTVGRYISEPTMLAMAEVYETTGWYEIARQVVPPVTNKATGENSVDSKALLRRGKELLAVLAKAYSSYHCRKDSETQWMRAIAKDPFIKPDAKAATATLADALDSMAVLANECAIMNYTCISELLVMCRSKTPRVMFSAMERLHAVFMELIPCSKLLYIHQVDDGKLLYLQKVTNSWDKEDANWDNLDPIVRMMLHSICFEDFVKGAYAAFIQVLTDQLDAGEMYVKRRTMHYIFEMLARKPEQEGLLMDILISKLLNEDDGVSSLAIKKLNELLQCQGGMKEVVLRRIGGVLSGCVTKIRGALGSNGANKSRTNNHVTLPSCVTGILKGMYRCILFMADLTFTRNELKATSEALKVYMTLLCFIFTRDDANGKSNATSLYEYEEFSRIIRCISWGLERCVRVIEKREGSFNLSEYCINGGNGLSHESGNEAINALYRAAHKPTSLSTNIGLLSLIFRLQPLENRFYNLLYERLLDLRMFYATSRTGFLALLRRCISTDDDNSRVAAFIKRLLQISMCIFGTEESIRIARLCRQSLSRSAILHQIVIQDGDGSYIWDKRDPRYSEADKCHLWETYLNRISYHPSVAFGHCSLLMKDDDEPLHNDAHSLLHELGAVAGQLCSGVFAYTTKSYWNDDKVAKPHEVMYKLFYKWKADCEAERKPEKSKSESHSVDSDNEDFGDIDDASVGSISEADMESGNEHSVTEGGTVSASDSDELSEDASYDGIALSDGSVSEDGWEGMSDTSDSVYDDVAGDGVSSIDSSAGPKDIIASRDLELADGRGKSQRQRKEDRRAIAMINKGGDDTKRTRERVVAATKRKSKSSVNAKVLYNTEDEISRLRKRRKPAKMSTGSADDEDQEKRKALSKLIQKATKGSFADIAGIKGLEDLL
ncbi:CEBPZ/Mak21 like protein [Babesia gibsoni]|uniref:CEBPZ/Mak21 like protein n=1 Tax=Babesia gibsoni TaxID=33632 RepID=A0AAD8LP00_BABGI|nr:CEBPZ/Mak21 like protein [Babesia gibsoni]